MARPTRTLAAVAAALREDGVFLMGDISASSRLEENIGHPLCPALYTFSVFYCMSVSLSEGGEGLGTVWGTRGPGGCSPRPASPRSRPSGSRETP